MSLPDFYFPSFSFSPSTKKMTIIGAGEYGVRLLGGMFVGGKLPEVALDSYVDPSPNMEVIEKAPLGSFIQPYRRNHLQFFRVGLLPLYSDIETWKEQIKTPENRIVDLALPESVVPKVFEEVVHTGIKEVILPKPVTFNLKAFQRIKSLATEKQIKVAVASNWFYSTISKEGKKQLDRLKKQYPIKRATVHYCKQRKKTPKTPPAHLELPHVLQILSSTGIMDFTKNNNPVVTKASQEAVAVSFNPDGIEGGVDVLAHVGKRCDTETGRMRRLEVFLDDGDPEPDVIVDYDSRFDKKGKLIRGGEVLVDVGRGKAREQRIISTKTVYIEDMVEMYRSILRAFKNSYAEYVRNPSVLTLERYEPLLKTISHIHGLWKDKMGENSALKTSS